MWYKLGVSFLVFIMIELKHRSVWVCAFFTDDQLKYGRKDIFRP